MKFKLLFALLLVVCMIQGVHANTFTDRTLEVVDKYELSHLEIQSILTDQMSERYVSPEAMKTIHDIQDSIDKAIGEGHRLAGPTIRSDNETIKKITDETATCRAPEGSTVFEGDYYLDMPNGESISLGKQRFTAGGILDKRVDVLEVGGTAYWVIYQYESCDVITPRLFSYDRWGNISETVVFDYINDIYIELPLLSTARLTNTTNIAFDYYIMFQEADGGVAGSSRSRYGPADAPGALWKYVTASTQRDMVEIVYERNNNGATPLAKKRVQTPPTDQPVSIEREEMSKTGAFTSYETYLQDSQYTRTFNNGKELSIYEFSSASTTDMILGLYEGDTLEKLYTHTTAYSIDEQRNMLYLENYLYDETVKEYIKQYRIIHTTTGKTYPITEGNNCLESTFDSGFGKNYFYTVGYDNTAEVPDEVTVCFYDHKGNYKKSFITETNLGGGGGRYSYDRFGFVGDTDTFYTLRYSEAVPDNDATIMYVDIAKNPMELYPLDSVIINSELILAEGSRIINRLDTITKQGATAYQYLDQFLPW